MGTVAPGLCYNAQVDKSDRLCGEIAFFRTLVMILVPASHFGYRASHDAAIIVAALIKMLVGRRG